MLGFIASNFLKIGNCWTVFEKSTTTVVYVENSRFYSNGCDTY